MIWAIQQWKCSSKHTRWPLTELIKRGLMYFKVSLKYGNLWFQEYLRNYLIITQHVQYCNLHSSSTSFSRSMLKCYLIIESFWNTPRSISFHRVSIWYVLNLPVHVYIVCLPQLECKLHEGRDFVGFLHCSNPST